VAGLILAAGILFAGLAVRSLQAAPAAGSDTNHWAYRPVANPVPPPSTDPSHTDIDRFIVAALRSRGLSLSPTASRSDWLRRATFDLAFDLVSGHEAALVAQRVRQLLQLLVQKHRRLVIAHHRGQLRHRRLEERHEVGLQGFFPDAVEVGPHDLSNRDFARTGSGFQKI